VSTHSRPRPLHPDVRPLAQVAVITGGSLLVARLLVAVELPLIAAGVVGAAAFYAWEVLTVAGENRHRRHATTLPADTTDTDPPLTLDAGPRTLEPPAGMPPEPTDDELVKEFRAINEELGPWPEPSPDDRIAPSDVRYAALKALGDEYAERQAAADQITGQYLHPRRGAA
jgi:hypothetical protein